MKQLYAPNGKLIIGTSELITGMARVEGFDEDGAPVFSGRTEVYWDDQKTKCGADGKIVVFDEDGNEHSIADCNVIEEQDEDEAI